jgi:aspartate aminotransferase
MRFAQRAECITLSQTLVVKKTADELKRQGVDIVDFGPGEPDFPTPTHIKNAAKEALDQNLTKYTAEVGIPELRRAIAERYNRELGTSYTPENVIVTAGAKQALFNIAAVLLEPGHEVIIPAPYWVSYPEQVRLMGARPLFVETPERDNFQLRAQTVERALTAHTRAVVINSPNNPTGAMIERAELEAIVRLAQKYNFYLISDECYEYFTYEKQHQSVAAFGGENVMVVSSVSKSYSMTGWRIGWAVAAEPLIKAMSKVQSHSTSHPASVAQHAALAALQGDQMCLTQMRDEYAKRREFVLAELATMPHVRCPAPQGAFYVFPNVSAFFGTEIKNSVDFSRFLLQEAHVAVVPGAAFGAEGYVRLSYATSMAQLAEGLKRLQRVLIRPRAPA